jgi:DNA-binding CsgD family transcriptional regulator
LSEHGVAQLATRQGARRIDPQRLHDLTRGNPFYVTELLAAGDETTLPQSVSAAVLTRAAQLDEHARRAFDAVSVVPGHAEIAMLNAVLDATALDGLGRCIDSGMLLLERDRVRFRHEIARRAAENVIAPATRRRLHTAALAWLRSGDRPAAARVAYHAAVIGDAQLVLDTAPAAAQEAANLGAHAEAAAHYAKALEFMAIAAETKQAELLEKWAYESGISGKIDDEVVSANQRALGIRQQEGNVEAIGRNLFWMARMLWYMGKGDEASKLAAAAVTTLQAEPDSKAYCLALSMRAQYLMLRDQAEEALAVGAEARSLAAKLDAHETLAHVLNTMGTARLMLADKSGHDLLDESLAISLKGEFHEQAARAYTNGTWSAIETRDYERAEKLARAGIAYDTEHDLDSWTPYLVGLFAGLQLTRGRIDEAIALSSKVLAVPRITTVVRIPAMTTLARAYSLTDEPKAITMLQAARALAEPTNEPMRVVRPVLLPLIEHYWLANNLDAARETLAACSKWNVESEWDRGEILVWLRRLQCSLPDLEGVRVAAPFAAELDGRTDEALAYWRKLGSPFDEAFILLTASAPSEADINRAIEIAETTGSHAVGRRARAVARELGVRGVKRGAYSAAKGNALGLTARELQMLDLLLGGQSNKEIASKLSRSLRTVEHHISALYGKLGAKNRAEAIRIWSERSDRNS